MPPIFGMYKQYSEKITARICTVPINPASHQRCIRVNTYTTDYSAFNIYGAPTLAHGTNDANELNQYTRSTITLDTVNLPTKQKVSIDDENWTTVSETSYYAATHDYKPLPLGMYSRI